MGFLVAIVKCSANVKACVTENRSGASSATFTAQDTSNARSGNRALIHPWALTPTGGSGKNGSSHAQCQSSWHCRTLSSAGAADVSVGAAWRTGP